MYIARMLPLLPALLLLIFRGPTGIERGPVDFRFSIADYRLERPGADLNSSQRGVAALLALSKNPAFSRTVAELLRYLPSDAANVAPELVATSDPAQTAAIHEPPIARESTG